MDGRKNNGAKKGENRGQGRKPKDEELKIISYIDATVSPDQWKELISVAYEKAMEGSIAHLKTILEYRFGKPKEQIDVTSNGEQVGAPVFKFNE